MQTSAAVVTSDPCVRASEGVAVLGSLLQQLVALLMAIDVDAYLARPAASVSGSVGEHVRHALDHVSALLAVRPSATLSYDHRERGTLVEVDRAAAVQQLLTLQAALDRWDLEDAPLRVATRVTPHGDSVTSWSTRSRELAFVISHTIHHQALMAVLLSWQGVGVPDRFGYAPSTPDRR